MLLEEECEILGSACKDHPRFVVRSTWTPLVAIVGPAEPEAIRKAVAGFRRSPEVLVRPADLDYVLDVLPTWIAEPAVIHELRAAESLKKFPRHGVRMLRPSETRRLDHLSSELATELKRASGEWPVVAAFEDGVAVSFGYTVAITEHLFDLSVETLDGFRGRGFATRCAAHLIKLMSRRRKRPVWGSIEWNMASLSVAKKLGFIPVDRLYVLISAEANASS